MRMTPRARCCRAGAGSKAVALHAKRRSIDCMVVGSQRCDWMRSDAQVGCLVCALPREHTKLPREQKPKGQGRAGETRETDASIEPRTGGAAVRLRPGDRTRNHTKNLGGQPTAPKNRRPREQCAPAPRRAPPTPHAIPKTPPTLSLVRGICSATSSPLCAHRAQAPRSPPKPTRTRAPAPPAPPPARAGPPAPEITRPRAPPKTPIRASR